MMHVHFHQERHHERERDLNRRLELSRLRADARPSTVEHTRAIGDPFRWIGQRARLLALEVKCLVLERA